MPSLATDLRSLLERTVVEARDVAELGARAALEALGVGDGKVHAHLKPEERDLRVRLRARARQLGDPLDAKAQVQAIDHLVREVAYEHWHRMLFARFLAESHLLVEPETGVAVSLDECRELARERGEDPWELAGRFAERMLPAIFRSNDPALALMLPPERLNRLEALLEALPVEVFSADDALGWVYQFWQSKRKKEVNASGRKIGADELPAVTQLFTEPYMVRFLLHNTLGAWHAGKVLAARPELATSAKSEAELRRACALPGYDWTYLRFVRDPSDTDPWRPAAGNCPGWPSRALEVTFMDPCCGSGHFLVEAFSALVALRQSEEGLDLPGAVRAVLALNLHGLEIDPRCTQLAAFAVAFAAWRKLGRVSPLPPIQIGCSGLATGVPKTEWLRLVGDDPALRRGMERLHDLFHKAPTLGSLLDPRGEVGQDLFTASLERLEKHLIEAVRQEEVARDAASAEVAVTATGMTSTVRALIRQYTLVATNVPFLGRESHEVALSTHLESHFPAASADLSAAMLLRASALLLPGGSLGLVLPQNWWAGTAYEDFRSWALTHLSWNVLAALGEEAWLTFADRGPNTCLFISSKSNPVPRSLVGIDVSSKPREKTIRRDEKDALLQGKELAVATRPHSIPQLASQSDYWRRPGKKIFLGKLEDHPTLATIARSGEGSSTGDSDRFSRCYWEVKKTPDWTEYCGPGNLGDLHCECREYIFWEEGKGELAQSDAARIQNTELWKEDGVLVGRVRGVTATPFFGGSFKKGAVLLVPRSKSDLALLLAFASSAEYEQSLRNLDPRVSAATSTVTEVPVDLGAWRERAAQAFENGVPLPTCADPSQWLFHGHPARAGAPLQVAVARLLGFRWPAELDPEMRLSTEAREWVKRSEGLVELEDQDGIVCLSSLRNEEPATVRLRSLLAAAFGKEWSAAKERELLAATPEQAASLEEWLRDRFFEGHCALFHQRPFIWHVCDGRKDGFHALVNYHRLAEGNGKGRQVLESLAYAYLGEWIDRQRRGAAAGETGAEARLAAAVELQGELKKILDGEAPYDLFVRWKPLHRQPIGWEPDIDDGVRLNARPFLTATLSAGRAGAGLFRAKPNIHWKKDRGAEPQRDRPDFPWFYGSDGKFHGERHNDVHLSLDEKRRAREAKSKGGAKR